MLLVETMDTSAPWLPRNLNDLFLNSFSLIFNIFMTFVSWSIFLANSNRKLFTSTSNIFEAPKNLVNIICINPVGPAPNIATVAAFFKFNLSNDRKQHAIGSIKAAWKKLILSGSLISPPLERFQRGTSMNSESPHGSILLVWYFSHIVKSSL